MEILTMVVLTVTFKYLWDDWGQLFLLTLPIQHCVKNPQNFSHPLSYPYFVILYSPHKEVYYYLYIFMEIFISFSES